MVTAALIGVNEFYLTTRNSGAGQAKTEPLAGALYPRHRALVERSGALGLWGEVCVRAHPIHQARRRDLFLFSWR